MSELVTLMGRWRAVHKDRNGKVLRKIEGKNLVVQAGKDLVAGIVRAAGPNLPSHIAIGDGVTAPAESQTALSGTEHDRQATGTPTILTNVLTYTVLFTAGGIITVAEMGVFESAAAGIMISRWLVQPSATLQLGETLDVSWSLTFG